VKLLKFFLLLIIVAGVFSCSKKKANKHVIFDTAFLGARLDSIEALGTDKYIAHILPAFEPVNKSPWFAFGVRSISKRNIEVKLNYGIYKHRYIPKLSTDKKSWKKIESKNIEIDTVTGIATLHLTVNSKQLYVAAQEVESSIDTYSWIDNLLKTHVEIKKIVAGKTTLQKDNYVLELEKDSIMNAIVLVARQHPPETPGGTIGFKAFFETLIENSSLATGFRKRFNIYTFPLLNPDGADMGNWRHNAKGIDLNRDWVDFTQPETKMVKTYMEDKVKKGRQVRFALDFHTSYSGPYMLVLDSINEIKTKKLIPRWVKSIERNSKFKVETRRRSQKLPYCYNWFYNTFETEAITYEDGDEIDRKIIKERAIVYAKQLMKTMILMNDSNEF